MQTVNAAVGPKVNQHDLAAEVLLEGNRLTVEPGVVLRKFRYSEHRLVRRRLLLLLLDEVSYKF